jgi:lambda family phage tail tape measure protein
MADLTAQMVLTADASGVEAGVGRAKRSLADLGATAATEGKKASDSLSKMGDGSEKSAAKIESATKNVKASLERYVASLETGKKTGVDFIESIGRQRGANLDALKPLIDQARALEAQTKKTTAAVADLSRVSTSLGASSFSKPLGNPTTLLGATGFGAATAAEAQKAAAVATQSLGKIGVSAAQTANALRGVPAQFTDIVTSLQGGQAPLTVLLQQGGQLKDMFGGIGPAARALGGYIGGLINPFTLAAGAVAVLGYAFYSATERTEQFNKALINTGNYVGKSASDLNDLAKAVSGTIGTQGQAADALAALAGSGKIAGESLQLVGAAVVAQNKAMGTSIEDAVAQFVKLADEPTKASAKLNESLHYLNLSTYERIRALEEQGNKEAAAALAQDTYAKATVDRMQQVINQSGLLSKALSGTKDVALGMWNAIAQGIASIGATQSAADKLVDAQRKVAYLKQNGSTPEALAEAQGDVASLSRQALRQKETAEAEGIRATFAQQGLVASDAVTKWQQQAKGVDAVNRELKKYREQLETIRRENPKSDALDPAKIAAGEDAIRKQFQGDKGPKGAAPKAFQDDAATKMLESLRQQEAALKEQLTTDEKLTSSEKERAKFVQLVADLKTKGTLTIEQKSLLLAQDSIKAQLDKNVALEDEVKAREKAAKLVEKQLAFEKQLQGVTLSYESANASRAEQYDRILSTAGLGDRARQEVEAQKAIRREYDRYVLQTNKQAADASTPEFDAFATEAYKQKISELKGALEEQLDAQRKFYAREQADRENWLKGATSALANYIDYVDNAAQRANALITNSLSGLSDSITEAIFGDKGASFKKLGENISKQIVHGIVEQQITKPVAEWLQGSLSDPESMIGKLLGGLTSNKDTGENWLGFLGLGGGGKGGSAATRGSSLSNPLFVKSVDAAAAATGGSGGGGILGMLGGLFGGGSSNSAATSMANSMPGDALDNLINLQGGWGTMLGFANGGDPPMGRASIVGERGPELFIPKQPGTVVPAEVLQSMRASRGAPVVNIAVEGQVDRRTRTQIANDTSLALRRGGRMA